MKYDQAVNKTDLTEAVEAMNSAAAAYRDANRRFADALRDGLALMTGDHHPLATKVRTRMQDLLRQAELRDELLLSTMLGPALAADAGGAEGA